MTVGYPSVSVVVPAFNCRQHLGEAIASALVQTPQPVEILVINDGSTDGHYQCFSKMHHSVRVIDTANAGVSAARNRGILEARSDLIAFLDADDVWLPGKLESQLRVYLEKPEAGLVFGRFQKWFPEASGNYESWQSFQEVGVNAGYDLAHSGWLYGQLLCGLLVGTNTAVVPRALLKEVGGFDERRRYAEDYELWLRISRQRPMYCVDGLVALYRVREGSAMSQLQSVNYLAELLLEASARWGLSGPNESGITPEDFRDRLAQVHFNLGYDHFWRGRPEIACREFATSAQYVPSASARRYSLLSRFPAIVRLARHARKML